MVGGWTDFSRDRMIIYNCDNKSTKITTTTTTIVLNYYDYHQEIFM